MNNVKKITENIIYVGAGDRGMKRFENVYPIPRGMAYNSYVISDDKIAIMDTIYSVLSDIYLDKSDRSIKRQDARLSDSSSYGARSLL